MIAAAHLNLKINGVEIKAASQASGADIITDSLELPQYADTIIFEVKGDTTGTNSFRVQFQTSHDGVNWYNVGSEMVSDSMQALSDDQDHIFLNIRASINSASTLPQGKTNGDVEICKVHFRRHKR